MKIAESVTFGGSGLERAAELRGKPDEIQELMTDPNSLHTVFWRGKPLMSGDLQGELARLAPDHPVLREAAATPIFLGREQGNGIFAHDLSRWEPDELEAAQMGAFLDATKQHHPSLPSDHLFCELRAKMWWMTPRDAELAATARALFEWHRTHRFCSTCGEKSDMAMSGWQRNCPSCGRSHFPRTDPVVIMLITRGDKVLMGRSPGWPEGMYSLLAGFVEPGETVEAAVRREVFEETGIKVNDVTYLASQPWPFPASLMLGCWGEAVSEEIQIDPNEIEDARWIGRDEMLEAFAGRHPHILPARKGAIAQFILSNWLADRLE